MAIADNQTPLSHPLIQKIRPIVPGMMLALTLAAAAQFLANHYGAPQMLFALLLGLAFHFLWEDAKCIPGIDFASSTLLRFGVALLGMRITVDEVMALGWHHVALVTGGVIATILFGVGAARLLKRRIRFGTLTGSAVAICGASAALAVAAILPKSENGERDTIFTVIAVTTFSTLAMIVYPLLVSFLGFGDHDAGIFLGATIHDVAQVVGAGYTISPEAGDVATVTKLFRVALLVPIVVVMSFLFRKHNDGVGKLPIPFFVIGFCVCVGINTAQVVPEALHTWIVDLSRWSLVTAISALGVKTSLKAMTTVGYQPIVLVLAETVFIALWVLIGIILL